MTTPLNGEIINADIPNTDLKYSVIATTSLTGEVEFGIKIGNDVVCGCKLIHKRDGHIVKPFVAKAFKIESR
jgi:hypothetical protein